MTIRATPHNGDSGLRRIFCPNRAVWKMGNTSSIPAFSILSLVSKSLAESPCPIMRCCLNNCGVGEVPYSRPHFKLCVIPNQSSDWCGNLHRHRDRVLLTGRLPRQCDHWLAMTGKSRCGNLPRTAGRIPNNVSFRTSPQTGVGISPVIETASSKRWRLPHQ